MIKIDPSIYQVKLFQKGYSRQKCSKCGSHFWSLRKRNDCGDAPCTIYTFFDVPVKHRYTYREVHRLFLDFFRRNGHEVVEPRPVVARWREDLYLTIASIVVFQPHVTSGITPPPANPLVIAQPCIRLEDIDNVGMTFGRHLTNFVMGGHHAFNYPDKFIYWTDETVDYAKRFFVEEIGVPEDEITFKESWWEGGGNAGPCFEVSVGGLELATLVFMMYRVEDGKYSEIPIKIVDTGYGIERIAWLTQKTPTAFHAVYGSLVTEFHKILNIPEPPEDMLRVATILSAVIKPQEEGDIDELFRLVADKLGTSFKEVKELIKPAIDVYALLDHTKTIALMLSDGIVPSNSGEGYLARLVIRRTLRRLHKLASIDLLPELIMKQISYWYDMYPQLYKAKDRILDMINVELEKYRDVIRRVSTIAMKFSRKAPSLDDLVLLYDSQGIPPDLLKDELEKRYGVAVKVPTNFYSIVASKHSRPRALKESEKIRLPQDIVAWASSFPETRRLFHEDAYMRYFTAKVLGINENFVILDATAFYPEGGGQLGDRGYLEVSGRRVRVIDTQKVGNVVVHVLESPLPKEVEGQKVIGEVDWLVRYRRMKHHTATHILLGAIRRVLGDHVWQAGAEKTEEKARLDVTHYKMPSQSEIEKIEKLANTVVDNAIPIRIHYLPKNEAEKIYGFALYQGGVPMYPIIRVVEIPEWDAEACFGTHVRNTSEVGAIKIVNVEKIADGIVRFEFVASTSIPNYVRKLETELNNIAKQLNADRFTVHNKLSSLMNTVNELREILRYYRAYFIDQALKEIFHNVIDIEGLKLAIYTPHVKDRETYREVLRKATLRDPKLILVLLTRENKHTYFEISLGSEAAKVVNAKDIVATAISTGIALRGGGKPDHVSGITELDIERFSDTLKKLIVSKLRKQS